MLGRTRLIVGAVAGTVLFGAGWAVNGWRHDAKLARVERDHSQERAEAAGAALD